MAIRSYAATTSASVKQGSRYPTSVNPESVPSLVPLAQVEPA